MKYNEYINLANKSENKSFVAISPIQFCYKFTDKKDIEIAGIISSWLYYGNIKDSKSKIDRIIREIMGNKPYEYILSDKHNIYIDDYSSIYRMTTWHNFAILCSKLKMIYLNNIDLEDCLLDHYHNKKSHFNYYYQYLCDMLSGGTMIQTGDSHSSNNRMNQFMRWMVRHNSKVDLGIWKQIEPKDLLVSCDMNTIKAANELGITFRKDCSLLTCKEITNYAHKMFYDDPARMDFALYGYGIKNKS